MDGMVRLEVSRNGAKALRTISAEMGKIYNQIMLADHELLNVVLPLKDDLGPKAERIRKIHDDVHDKNEASKLSLMQLMQKLSDLADKIDHFCDKAES